MIRISAAIVLLCALVGLPSWAALPSELEVRCQGDRRWEFEWTRELKGITPESAAAVYTDFDRRKEITPQLEISKVLFGGQTACVLVEYLFRSILVEHSQFWNQIKKHANGYTVDTVSDGATTNFQRSCQFTEFLKTPQGTRVAQKIFLVGPPPVGERIAESKSKAAFDQLTLSLARPATREQIASFQKKLHGAACSIPEKNPTDSAKKDTSLWPSFRLPSFR